MPKLRKYIFYLSAIGFEIVIIGHFYYIYSVTSAVPFRDIAFFLYGALATAIMLLIIVEA